jgi:tRNA(adenine34) deaminase
VVVRDGAVVAAARNERELRQDPTAHAEVLAIRDSSIALGGWRLVGCTVYVTLEPCPMCAGALLQARPERVVYGAPEPVSGAAGSVVDIFRDPRLPTRIPVEGGVMAVEAADLLRAFFAERRGH